MQECLRWDNATRYNAIAIPSYFENDMRFPAAAGLLFALTATLPAQAEESTWSYDADVTGQEDWGSLSPLYAPCALGTQQSPVQISYPQIQPLPLLEMRYSPSRATLQLRENTLLITMEENSFVTMGTHRYVLKQIRFHSPSEHTVRDLFWPVEIHFIHKDADGHTLIVAVWAEKGPLNDTLQAILDHAPQKRTDSVLSFSFDPGALLPTSRGYYAYTGSLTSPPCSEGVEWRLFKQPITLSQEQLLALTQRVGRNARLTQPIYMRTIGETRE